MIDEHKERLRKQLEDFEAADQRRAEYRAAGRQTERRGGARDGAEKEKPSGPGRRGESREDDEEEESSEESDDEVEEGEFADHAKNSSPAPPDPSGLVEETFEIPSASGLEEAADEEEMETKNGSDEVEI